MPILVLKIGGEAKKQLLELQQRDLIPALINQPIEYPGQTESLHLTLGTMNSTKEKYAEMLKK
ncbi:MAG: hypothetical protein H0T84_03650 [Tatlockia sp.]|nr:hypothetical protein [Tatlockia sp.]